MEHAVNFIDVAAEPGREDRSILRKELPKVIPYPLSKGFDYKFSVRIILVHFYTFDLWLSISIKYKPSSISPDIRGPI